MITKVKVLVVKSSETSHLLQPTLTEKVEETLRITTPPPIAGGHGKKSAKKARVWSLRLTTMLGRLVRHSQCLCRGRRREKCKLFPLKIFPPMALLVTSNLGGVLQLYKSILAIVSVNVPALLDTTCAKSKQRIFGWYFLVDKFFCTARCIAQAAAASCRLSRERSCSRLVAYWLNRRQYCRIRIFHTIFGLVLGSTDLRLPTKF